MSSSIAATSVRLSAQTRVARRAARSRSRAFAWAEIAALALITVALVAATIASANRVSTDLPSQRVRVESGQTVWALASQHPVAGFTTEQTAEVIARLNDLDGGALTAGSMIRIPVEASTGLLVASR